MAVKMVVFWFSLVLLIVGSQAAGEFDVIHSPRSLKFTGSSRTLESLLKEIFSASLGLSVEEDAEWDGLSIIDPFTTPEAVVEIYIDGVSSLGNMAGLKSHAFPLVVDEYEPDTFEAIQHRIKQRFSNGGNKLVKVKLSDPNELAYYSDIIGEIKTPKVSKQTYQHLKYSVEEDYSFLYELETLKAITAKVKSGVISADNIIDFYNFRLQSLHALSDFHGPNSLQVKEAKKLLGQAIGDLSLAFVKAYDGSVLVTTVTTDVAHTRRTVREAPEQNNNQQQQTKTTTLGKTPEVVPAIPDDIISETNDLVTRTNSSGGGGNSTSEDSYSGDYAAIFNIILWFSVVFVFSLVAIVYAIMDMDPGRDSIIYRMTSTRMKKDN